MAKKTILTSLFTAAALVGGVTATSLVMAAPAAAQSDAKQIVDDAKAKGVIGETSGGYLKVVSSASRDVVNAMNEINIRRKSAYTRLARKQNVPIEQVAAYTAEKYRATKAKSGQKYLGQSGEWVTIP